MKTRQLLMLCALAIGVAGFSQNLAASVYYVNDTGSTQNIVVTRSSSYSYVNLTERIWTEEGTTCTWNISLGSWECEPYLNQGYEYTQGFGSGSDERQVSFEVAPYSILYCNDEDFEEHPYSSTYFYFSGYRDLGMWYDEITTHYGTKEEYYTQWGQELFSEDRFGHYQYNGGP
jgi:hypothetical protein